MKANTSLVQAVSTRRWPRVTLLLVLFSLPFMMAWLTAPALAEVRPNLVINGTSVEEVPTIYRGVIFVPVRALSEHLRIKAGWLAETKTVRLSTPDSVVYMRVGERTALATSSVLKLSEAPRLVDGQVLVPLRALAGVLGLEVEYVQRTQTVKIEGPRYRITSIAYGLLEGQPVITLTADGPIESTDRIRGNTITVELPKGRLQAGKGPLDTGNPVIRRVEWDQVKPTMARVKVSLSTAVPYTVERDPNRPSVLRLRFQKQVMGAGISREDGAVRINLSTSGPPTTVKTSRLTDPERLVADLEGYTLAARAGEVKPGDPWIKSIRFGQLTPSTVRVVIDTAGPADLVEEAAPTGEHAALRILSRVNAVSVASAKDRTRVRVALGLPVDAGINVQRRASTLVLHIPSAVLAKTIEPLKPGDGVVERVEVAPSGRDQVDVVVSLPIYAGHRVVREPDGSIVLEVDKSPVVGRKVYLDAGHGGTDPGAIGPSGLFEKDVNLDVTLKLGRLLTEAGATVLMARGDDVFIPLWDRPRSANAKGADLFVSIHSNANVKPQDSGTETYYHPEKPGSKVLAQLVQAELVKELGLINRQTKTSSGLVVTRETTMPAILVEVAFLSNPVEEQLLADPAFRERAAGAIWRGVQEFFRQLLDNPALAKPFFVSQSAPPTPAPPPQPQPSAQPAVPSPSPDTAPGGAASAPVVAPGATNTQ